MSENHNDSNEEIELVARLFANDLKEYAKITGGLDDLIAKNVYGILRDNLHSFRKIYKILMTNILSYTQPHYKCSWVKVG